MCLLYPAGYSEGRNRDNSDRKCVLINNGDTLWQNQTSKSSHVRVDTSGLRYLHARLEATWVQFKDDASNTTDPSGPRCSGETADSTLTLLGVPTMVFLANICLVEQTNGAIIHSWRTVPSLNTDTHRSRV